MGVGGLKRLLLVSMVGFKNILCMSKWGEGEVKSSSNPPPQHIDEHSFYSCG